MISKIIIGDALTELKNLPDQSVNCCVTSPPYWGLRDYGVEGQLGLEKTPQEFVDKLVNIFREVRRVLKDDGTLWLNLGDTVRRKDLVGIPWRVAFALQNDGWFLRQDIVWHKPNPMPESVTDRCTKAHEYIFLLSKSSKYYFDQEAIKEFSTYAGKRENKTKGSFSGKHADKSFRAVTEKRNKRSVWTVPPAQFKDAHFATYPPELIKPCILAGSKPNDLILDPFFGAGTTGLVAKQLGRNYLGIELNEKYAELASQRIAFDRLL